MSPGAGAERKKQSVMCHNGICIDNASRAGAYTRSRFRST